VEGAVDALLASGAATAGVGGALMDGTPGLLVTISIPAGVELAARTFNPRLGIEGGISVLGTGGIVRPMSEDALIASIELEMRMLYERGVRDLLVVPGNYGRDFACGQLKLNMDEAVSCSNYFGATLDAACVLGFERMLIVGHIGKMAKVAGGIMNTHSRVADCRVEVLAAHAALVGAPQRLVADIMGAATTDAALDALKEASLDRAALDSLMRSLADKLNHRAAGRLQVEAIVFSNVHGVLGETPGAESLARTWLGVSQ
jgi:cobalt-precorrin-5B (C1)-methyltransferase